MKVVKIVLRYVTYLTLFLLTIGLFFSAIWYYQFEIKPSRELAAYDGEGNQYEFVKGQLRISDDRIRDYVKVEGASVSKPDENVIPKRKTISLNGIWEIAEGDFDSVPTKFNHSVPVPGFADLANPRFTEVGDTKPLIGLGFLKPSQFMSNMKFKDVNREAFWYKKNFVIQGKIPEFSQLKVHRAQYGSAVWLNGVKLGENGKHYQPGFYDTSKVLKGNGEKNELIIRVGTSITFSENNQNIYGDALEKDRHLPGIYDDVELLLSGEIKIERVQIVPNISKHTARVITWVKNRGEAVATKIKFKIKIYQTDSIVGHVETSPFFIKENETKIVEVEVPIKNCQLWSPESPNLYTLITQSENDDLRTRFGMREFHFDEKTKIPTLNNRPYYLRGTSVAFFRYIENPYRKDEVWNEEWVRTVFRRFKEMNWNTVRFHVGVAPSLWYRIADEEGMVIQDEYAVWGFHLFRMGVSLDTFVEEYIGWMEEHWNHASILIWDAQNESTQKIEPRTGWALNIVRGLDESNRPWDNGWGDVQANTDTKEIHPYIYTDAMFNPMGSELDSLPDLSEFNATSPDSIFLADGKHPVLVNEYSWLWVRRDGKGTDLTEAGFSKYYKEATPEEHFERYAYDCAAQTEYYRALRAAGVMQFAGLNSDYEGCKTTDIFSNIENLTIESNIKKYVKNAFSPLGICVFNWSSFHVAGSELVTPIVLINDTSKEWKGEVLIEIVNDEKKVEFTQMLDGKVNAFGKEIINVKLKIPTKLSSYKVKATIIDFNGEEISSIRKFQSKVT